MKRVLLIGLIAIGLSGCSTYNSLFGASDDSVKVNPDDNIDNPDQEGENLSTDKPTASIKLEYKSETNEIDARMITNWDGAPQGTVYLTWRAPKDTNCYSTSFPITKFKDIQDYTVDNQSVKSGNNICQGTWTATIVNKSDNSELAKASVAVQ